MTITSKNIDLAKYGSVKGEQKIKEEGERGLDMVYKTLRDSNIKEMGQWRREEPLDRNRPYSLFENSQIERPREEASVKDIFASLNDLTQTLQARMGISAELAV